MDTRAPPEGPKRNRAKEFIHDALHKIGKIKRALAFWSRDPRSRRSSNLPGPDITSLSRPPQVEPTPVDSKKQSIYLPMVPNDPHAQGGTQLPAKSPPLGTSGVEDVATPLPSGSGPNTADPRLCRSPVWAHLEAALITLEKGTHPTHPFHTVARAVLDCLDTFEAFTANDKTDETMGKELNDMVNALNDYVAEIGSEPVSEDIIQIAESIRHYTTHITQQQKKKETIQMLENGRDQEDVANTCRRIASISQQLQTAASGELLRRANQLLPYAVNAGTKSGDAWLADLDHVEAANYNSDFSAALGRRGCTAETRKDIQDRIKAWAQDIQGANVLWMSGMPGTGKTTISYSLCEWLQREQLLGASYFCNRMLSTCSNLKRLIPTIAYQLAKSLPAFQSALCEAIEEHGDPSVLESHLQFQRLLVHPLNEAKDLILKHLVIVIDGLDECEDDSSIQQILGQLLNSPTNLPIKIFITSRPEPVIYDSIMAPAEHTPTVIHLDDADPALVRADIKKYLNDSLANLSPSPTEEQIERLASLAGNLFIYAKIIVLYVLPTHEQAVSIPRLQSILKADPNTRLDAVGLDEVYKPLYALYSTVLEQPLKKNLSETELENLKLVLWTVVCAQEPMTIETLRGFTGIGEDGIAKSLRLLRSIIHVSGNGGHVIVPHTSFSHFLRNPSQPTVLHCNEELHSRFLSNRCFEVMRLQLRFNICGLESSFIADTDVFELERRVNQRISMELLYACRYWSYHLQRLNPSNLGQMRSILSEFLSTQLLFWVEVLSLRKCVEIGAAMLFSTISCLPKDNTWTNIQQNLLDSRNFVTRFASNSCSRSTAHIYISALPACPRSSLIYKNFWPLTGRLLNITGSTVNRDQDATLARWLAGAPVPSLACSTDGAKVASGSRDGNIQLWNTHTGTMIGKPIKEHDDVVCSMKFSPDDTLLASGSSDYTVCLYDMTSAEARTICRLTGHEGPVVALAFSSDSRYIASGSGDNTVRLWSSQSGALVGEPLKGEVEIRAMAFLPDGGRIITAGNVMHTAGNARESGIIQSWDISTPDRPSIVQVFSGHEGRLSSVDISPDCTRIVSGSGDKNLRLWRVDTGAQIGEPLEGHTAEISVIRFSPDGGRIVSGSTDHTIQIWDLQVGSSTGRPLEGHSGPVGAIALSRDNTRVFSGSDDATIRLWDADATILTDSPNTHSSSVCSVTFSTKNDLIISGSDDKSVRVWNVHTGTLINSPVTEYKDSILSVACSPDNTRFAAASRDGAFLVGNIHPGARPNHPVVRVVHPEPILSIAFSADGSRLVTGSYDRTVRIWDPRTLDTIDKPFTDHGGPVTAVALARRGDMHLVASGSGDGMVRVCDTMTATETNPPLLGHESSILSVACSPTGACIISGSYDKTIRVWDGYTGSQAVGPIVGHTGPVRSVALFESPYGSRTIVSGSDDKTVRLWDAYTGAPIGQPLKGHQGPVLSVSFSLNGKYVVSGSADGAIRVWDIKSRWDRSFSIDPYSKATNTIGISSWTFHDDGWVTEGDRLLFWVPQVHHAYLKYFIEISSHPCSLIISRDISYGVESWDLALGAEWTNCFNLGQ